MPSGWRLHKELNWSFDRPTRATLHGKRNVGRHKEAPERKITTECGAAVREIKKLAKELRDFGNGSGTIRSELEKKQVMRGLSGQGKDAVIELLLKP